MTNPPCKRRSGLGGHMHVVLGVVTAVIAAMLLFPISVEAADQIPLIVEVEATSYLSRTAGPYPLHLTLRWGGPSLLEGRLRIDVRDGEDLKCTLLSDELVLNRGDMRSTWLIPMTGSPNGMGQLTLVMTWVGDSSA